MISKDAIEAKIKQLEQDIATYQKEAQSMLDRMTGGILALKELIKNND